MPNLLSMPLDASSDDVLVFEVDREELPNDLVLASTPGELTQRAKVTFEEAIESLKPSLRKLVQLLNDLSPHETCLEFGLKIGGETGIVIAKGTGEVNFAVRLSWKSD